MGSNTVKEQNSFIKIYQEAMDTIQFMHQYRNDLDIFNPGSVKFRNFLIQSFAYLHSDFHYLSFLSNDDIHQELIKVSGILQILSINPGAKNFKFFDNMSEDDVHKFWLRFFSLFKHKNEFLKVDSTMNVYDHDMQFFKSMRGTLNYLNHDFPEINPKKLKNINFIKEIEKWNENVSFDFYDSLTLHSTFENFEANVIYSTDSEKIIEDIKQIVTLYSGVPFIRLENKINCSDTLINFTAVAKDILKYKNDLKIIDSVALSNIYDLLKSDQNNDWPGGIYFLKRYNNLINLLKSKLKLIS